MNGEQLHIALLTSGLYPYVVGGMQKHSYYLAKNLAEENVLVDIYLFTTDQTKINLGNFFSEAALKNINFIK